MDDLYRDYILEHYRRPHNFGVIDDPTASFEGSNPLCGDEIKGKPVTDVEAFRADDLLDLLGIDISPARLKCAMLSHDTLQKALAEAGTGSPAAQANA